MCLCVCVHAITAAIAYCAVVFFFFVSWHMRYLIIVLFLLWMCSLAGLFFSSLVDCRFACLLTLALSKLKRNETKEKKRDSIRLPKCSGVYSTAYMHQSWTPKPKLYKHGIFESIKRTITYSYRISGCKCIAPILCVFFFVIWIYCFCTAGLCWAAPRRAMLCCTVLHCAICSAYSFCWARIVDVMNVDMLLIMSLHKIYYICGPVYCSCWNLMYKRWMPEISQKRWWKCLRAESYVWHIFRSV